MNRVLVDTNVVSYVLRNDSRAALYRGHMLGKVAAISVISLGELYRWPVLRQWSEARMMEFREHVKRYELLSIDQEVCEHWARIASIRGRPRSYHDSWIAATALRFNLPLVTHDSGDFAGTEGLSLLTENKS